MPAAAALALTAALFHVFNHSRVQEPAVLRRRRGAHRDRRARHGAPRRPHPSHAAAPPSPSSSAASAISALPPLNGFVSEWLTFQAILLSPQLPQWGLEVPRARGRRAAGAVGGARRRLLRQGVRHHLPRPAAHAGRAQRAARPTAARSRRCSRFAALCLLAGILPGFVIDALAPVVQALVGAPHAGAGGARLAVDRADRREPQLLQRPAGVRLHRDLGASLAADVDPPLRLARACAARRPGTAAIPTPSPATQYTAGSFAQPIRRVFGSVVFRAREHVDMPPPGDARPARLDRAAARPRLGRALRADRRRRRLRRRPAQPSAVPDHPPLPQPGVRRPRRSCCWCSRYGRDPRPRRAGRADAAGAAAGAAAHRLRAQGQGAPAAAPRDRRCCSPIATCCGCCARRSCWRDNASWLFRVAPYLIFAATWVAAALVPTFATGLAVQLVGRPDRHHRAARQRALLPGAGRARRRHQLRRHRLEPRDDDRLAGRAGDAHDRVHAGAGRRLDPALHHRRPSCCRPTSACACRSAWRWSR